MRGRYSEGEDQFSAWQHAVELYRGPFLQGHDETWIMDRRKAMRTGYLEAVMGMARTYVDRGKGETALKLYRSALDEDFSREDLHRELMLLYNELGRRGEAVAHFQQLEKAFNEQDVTLSPQTIEVYNNIMA
jgi:two-component SAPR family response regulator